VLKADGVSSNDILSTLLSVLRASWPAHAFEVHGAIHRREGALPCGVTVHALRLPNEPAGHLEVWAKSWDEAARQAADGAVAALLPRTRTCVGPWVYWRRYRLPVELLAAYREAATFERARRYDEALKRYSDALELDPTNLTIAVLQGQLLEKIGLFLGALTAYQRILALDNPGRRPVPRGVYSRAARREWRNAVNVAK
jgi:tetratricopeptide (TPR) repeat protein